MIVGNLIAGALRKLGALASGATVASNEAEDALGTLRQMYLEMVGNGTFGRQANIAVPVGTVDFTAAEGSHFLTEDLRSINIALPDFVADTWWRYDYGRSFSPYGAQVVPSFLGYRPPLDGALVTAADLNSDRVRTYVYDSALGRWTDLANLDVGDPAPLSTRYGDGLMCELAIRMAPEYGSDIPPAVVRGAAQGRSAMVTRFDGPERIVRGNFF